MSKSIEERIDEVWEDGDLPINNATEVARVAHEGQTRDEGVPFITHPKEVRNILVNEYGVRSQQAQVVALLHDVLEDTEVTYDILANKFGNIVASWVESLTVKADNQKTKQLLMYQNVRCMPSQLLAIKMADRTHNLRCLKDSTRSHAAKIRYLNSTEKLMHVIWSRWCAIESYEVLTPGQMMGVLLDAMRTARREIACRG